MEDLKTIINDLAEVLNSDGGVPNMIWVKDEVNKMQKLVNKNDISQDVKPRFTVSLVYQNTTANMLRVLILRAENKHAALGEAIEYFEDETKGYALILKTVIELNGA